MCIYRGFVRPSGLRLGDVRRAEPGPVLRLPPAPQPGDLPPAVPLGHVPVRDALPVLGAGPLRAPLPPLLRRGGLPVADTRLR